MLCGTDWEARNVDGSQCIVIGERELKGLYCTPEVRPAIANCR
jgi:hypothetical protein